VCIGRCGRKLCNQAGTPGFVIFVGTKSPSDGLWEDFKALPFFAEALKEFKSNNHPKLVCTWKP